MITLFQLGFCLLVGYIAAKVVEEESKPLAVPAGIVATSLMAIAIFGA